MTIQRPQPSEKPAIRRLWEDSFPEGGLRYVDWFFDEVYTPGNTLTLTEDGSLISALQMIPYPIRLRGRAVEMDTLTGVATASAHKNRGYSKRLMAAALLDMAQRGRGFTFLYPFDHCFYRRLGWETTTAALEYLRPPAEIDDLPDGYAIETTETPQGSVLAALYDRYMAGCNCAVIRREPHWRKRLGELRSLGGYALIVSYRGTPMAYALYEESDDEILIGELVALTCRASAAAVAALKGRGKPILWRAPEDDRSTLLECRWIDRVRLQPYVMMRITDCFLAVEQAAPSCSGSLMLELTGDSMVSGNNGVYRLEALDGSARLQRAEGQPQFRCAIGSFCRILTGYMTASEAVAAGLAEGREDAVSLLDKMYPKRKNYIFEMY